MQKKRHTVRNLDPELLKEARIHAIETGQTLGDVINESLEIYFELEEEDVGSDLPSIAGA